MKQVELYTYEDAKRELEEGLSEAEAVVKKWESIVNALRELEGTVTQLTPFCERYIEFDCNGCPLLKYDLPCDHPGSTYVVFYQELKKLRMIGESYLMTLLAVQKSEDFSKSFFV
jgi:hypothetical protein